MHLVFVMASLFSWLWPNHDNSNGAMFAADLAHTSVYESDPLLSPPTLKWQQKLDVFQERPPVATDGLVYCPTVSGTLYACERGSGAIRWKAKLDGRFAASLAVVEEAETLFVGATDGRVYAFDSAKGTLKWKEPFGTINSSPAVYEGVLYFGTEEGDIWAVEGATGESRWGKRFGGLIEGAVSIDTEKGLLYACANGTLVALSLDKGETEWSKTLGRVCGTCPVLHDGKIYITNDQSELLSISGETGNIGWKLKGPNPFATPAVSGNTLFWPTATSTYSAIDLASGKVKWSFKANGKICREVAIAGSALYLVTEKGMVYGLNTDTGRELWHFPFKGAGQAGPTLCKGELFFTDGKGNLYALK